MDKQELEKIELEFNDYAKIYFGSDDYINKNLMMKLCHSRQVKFESVKIAEHIGLDRESINTAAAIGLLHDIGRFKQFAVYQTYCDHKSVNHSELGIEEINKIGILNHLSESQCQIVIAAISYHNRKDIPDGLNGDIEIQSKIIRDADKIDIFRVVLEAYSILKNTPEKFPLEIEFPDSPQYCQEIYNTVMQGLKIDYRLIRTMNDNRLLQAAWIYDLNFDISVKIIEDRGALEKLFEFLPQNEQIKTLYNTIKTYMQNRIINL